MYVVYKCLRCKSESILLKEDIQKCINAGKYLSCSYCGSTHIKKIKAFDSFKECMRAGEIDLRKV